ncbi:hypothetical protein COEREDRAFT_62035 [Coemansia reversa NRRL 1564]|uniref:ARM repeat-containing protein n=1 Tax=Coemansia reversa (strain ATCC 12441 / NRRL 1564) TaxID=763665 RepID=A0A2G5BE13_COERN|nr:hypothetical protein COEREDRAFT_62035 [Coemansia reversa NRRL 1564]|eukprot:PIA16947.1 hypothetical protein COEREDRAFT_62035 [Coemansia reversa NRRL 1564]
MPQKLRIHFCRILYELVTKNTIDLPLFIACCGSLGRILRREEKLTIADLEFDWRPLYDLTWNAVSPKIWQDNPIQNRTKLKTIIDLVSEANRFFPPSAAIDVFRELLPSIQFNSLDWQPAAVQLLNLFVPTACPPNGATPIANGPYSTDPKRWLPTIFSLWSFNLRTSGYDAYLMNLVTRLVTDQRGNLVLTSEQIRFVFASGLHFFNLPVTRSSTSLPRSISTAVTNTAQFYRMPSNGTLPLREDRALNFAKFIVYTMHDETPGGTLDLFEQLVLMIEPFYHPSNNGSWSGILARFLRHLSKELLERSRDEAADNCDVPESARLKRSIRRRFVVSVRTLAMLLLFSKGEDSVSMSHSTLKHLAEVEPDLIFRPLLDTLYTAIDSVTETHRMLSAMRALAKLATTLSNFSHYPEGAQHVAPLLTLTLPGIDVNDPTKTYFALSFVCNLCNNGVVFEELLASGYMPGSRPLSKSSSSDMDVDQDIDAPPDLDMEQIEWMTRASTVQFETWIDQYLRRVFALMDNLSSSLDTNESFSPDTNIESMAAHTTERVLLQCSERYHPMISRLMTGFATRITSLSAVGRMRSVVSAFALAMPEQALANLLPICCEKIAEEIENGVGLVPSLSQVSRSHSETTLIWFASILVVLTEGQNGTYLLRYKDQLISAVELLVCKCYSRQVYTIGCKLLHTTLMSLTRTTPLRGHSVSDKLWNEPKFRENHFRYWGQHPHVGDSSFGIDWHIANEQEIEFALELAHRVIEPRIGELDSLVDTAPHSREPNNKENVYLNRLLVTLCYSLLAMGCLVPPPGNPVELDDLSDDLISGEDSINMAPRYRLDRQVSAGYVFTDPESAKYKEVLGIREAIGRVAAKTLTHMASNKEDNVENIKSIVVLAQTVICHHGVDRSAFTSFCRSWNYGLDAFSIDDNTSIMPRYIAYRRARFTQLSRMFHNTRYMQVTELFRDITTQIARFCLSAYEEVRDYSISALENIMAILPAVKYPLIPLFLDELEDNESSDPEKMIGALRVLDSMPMRKACLRDWNYFPKMVLALCRAQHEDKPQVKRLIRGTAVNQVVHLAAPLAVKPLSEDTRNLTLELYGTVDTEFEEAIARDRTRCEQRYQFAKDESAKLVNALVGILRDAGTTWRFAAISGYYLDQLATVNIPVEPQLMATLAENLTSDLVLFRESAAINLSLLIGKIKQRSKLNCPGIAVSQRRTMLDIDSGDGKRFSGQVHTDICERALSGDGEATAAPFLDSPASGWFVWPQKAKVYVCPPPGNAEAFDHIDPESQEAYKALRGVLFTDGKWDDIARLFSIESMRSPDEDNFGVTRAMLFTQLFSLFELPLLDKAWSAIEQLSRDHEHVGAQRAASEIIGGLLRGSKHWAQGSLDRMWDLLIPLLDAVFSKLSSDTERFWQTCMHYAFARRDPRRYLPLIRLLLYTRQFDPHSEAPFAEQAKLEHLRMMVGSWDWRIVSAIVASRPQLLDALAHPYKQVRDVAGVLMYMLSVSEFSVSYPKVEVAIDDLARYGPTGRDFSHWEGTQRTQSLIQNMLHKVEEWKADHVPSIEGTSNYSRGSKTLLTFFISGYYFSSRRLTIEHLPSILPLVSVLQEQHDDEELLHLAKTTMQFFSQILYTASMSEVAATKTLALLEDSSNTWHVVTKTLPLLCTLTFANRFTLSRDIRTHILETTASFLEHEQIEVRQVALTSLTSLVKCANSQVIADANTRFSAMLGSRLPRVRYGKTPKDPAAYNRLVLTRHAGVLGLSCLVLAFPYAIPEWLPKVLVLLAGCIDDPNPIQSTVQRTFAEFRRTHMDTWHEDRKKFTSNQLEILTDMLVSPCYYA